MINPMLKEEGISHSRGLGHRLSHKQLYRPSFLFAVIDDRKYLFKFAFRKGQTKEENPSS